MSKFGWFIHSVERFQEWRVPAVVTCLFLCASMVVNRKWFFSSPYNMEEMTVISFTLTASWGVFIFMEVAGMVLMTFMRESMEARGEARALARAYAEEGEKNREMLREILRDSAKERAEREARMDRERAERDRERAEDKEIIRGLMRQLEEERGRKTDGD